MRRLRCETLNPIIYIYRGDETKMGSVVVRGETEATVEVRRRVMKKRTRRGR